MIRKIGVCLVYFLLSHALFLQAETASTLPKIESHDALKLHDKYALIRPTEKEVDKLLPCKVGSFYDSHNVIFSNSDYHQLQMQDLTCHLCAGDLSPINGFHQVYLKRMRERMDHVKTFLKEENINLETDLKIPPEAKWSAPANDEKELKRRWELSAYFNVLNALSSENPESLKDPKFLFSAIEKGVKSYLSSLESDRLSVAKLTEDQKLDYFKASRFSCADHYGDILPVTEQRPLVTAGFTIITYGNNKLPEVNYLLPGSLAGKSGLEEGDEILSVTKGEKIVSMTDNPDARKNSLIEIIWNHPSNKVGDKITLRVKKKDGNEKEIKIAYAQTLSPSDLVRYKNITMNPSGKTVRVISFGKFIVGTSYAGSGASTSEMVKKAIRAPGHFDSMLLDLRGNAGGDVAEAKKIAGFFLGDVPIAITEMKTKEDLTPGMIESGILKTGTPQIIDKPLMIYTDRSTASAAEILSGALQDHNRAIIFGDQTFGKGLIQYVLERQLKFTAGAYYRLSGKPVQHEGVTPDFILKNVTSIDPTYPMKRGIDIPETPAIKGIPFQKVNTIDADAMALVKEIIWPNVTNAIEKKEVDARLAKRNAAFKPESLSISVTALRALRKEQEASNEGLNELGAYDNNSSIGVFEKRFASLSALTVLDGYVQSKDSLMKYRSLAAAASKEGLIQEKLNLADRLQNNPNSKLLQIQSRYSDEELSRRK